MISLETFRYLVLGWIGIALILFPILMIVTVPYGRHSNKTWGVTISNKTGWILMEIPAIVVFALFIFLGEGIKSIPVMIFFILWMIHYVHRTFIFSARTRTKGKRMPLLIVIFGFFFNVVNGFINGYWFGFLSPDYPLYWLTDWRFIVGGALFVGGMIINQFHDNKLIQLRANNRKGYFIPKGGLFKYVSCPNFLGEIIEWGGYALMTWCLPTLAFFVWSFANLVPRAHDHHKWYNGHFKDYPKDRKAIFPHIY